jgi:hypothetical protein
MVAAYRLPATGYTPTAYRRRASYGLPATGYGELPPTGYRLVMAPPLLLLTIS